MFLLSCEEKEFLLIVFVLIFNSFPFNSAFNLILLLDCPNVQTDCMDIVLFLLQCAHYDAFHKDSVPAHS